MAQRAFNPYLRHISESSDIETVAMALSHGLTAHDRNQMGKKSFNPYALGIYMQAVEDFRDLSPKVGMQKALRECFTQNPKTGKYSIGEVEKVAKAVGISDAI